MLFCKGLKGRLISKLVQDYLMNSLESTVGPMSEITNVKSVENVKLMHLLLIKSKIRGHYSLGYGSYMTRTIHIKICRDMHK